MFHSTTHASLKFFLQARQHKVPSRSLLLIIAYLLFDFSLYAQTETLNDSWRWVQFNTETGLPSNRVSDIVETPAGTVWAITQSGLAWFDGYYWIPVGLPGEITKGQLTAAIPNEDDSLFVIIDGNLYFGGKKGFRPIPFVQNGRTLNPIGAARLSNGFLLAASSSLFVLRNGVIEPFNSRSGLQSNRTIGLWTTRNDGIWLNTPNGLYKWEQRKWSLKLPTKNMSLRASRVAENTKGEGLAIIEYPAEQSGMWEWEPNGMPTQNNMEGKQFIQALDLSPSNEAIVAYESGEVRTRRDGKWSSLKPLPPQMRNIVFLKFRDNGDLWVGTENNLYLHRRSSKRWTFWKHPSSALKNRINEILQTKNGSLWLARDLGIEIHEPNGKVLEIENINGATLKGLTGLAEDNDGDVWVSSGTYPIGAYRWNGVTWRHFGTKDGLGAENIHKIRRDREGKLWFLGIAKTPYGIEGEENEPGGYVYSQGRFSSWGIEKGLLSGRVYAFAEGADGALWFGTNGGLSRWKNGTWKHWTTKEGLRSDRVFALTIDNRNRLWFSDQYNGLSYVENDSVCYLTTVDGLVSNLVWDLRVDGRGKLWIATRAGLCSYDNGIWSTFDAATGLSNTLIWPILPVENKVYIGTTGGTAILNLDDASKLNPSIAISGPIVEGGTVYLRWDAYAFWGEIRHDYIDTRFRIDNEQWSSWNKEREKSFGNLSSGNHSFQLQAKSLFGNFDEGGKTVAFTIEPILFLRPIFYAPFGILSAAIAVLVAAYGMRKRRDAVALRASEEKFRSFVESTKELVWSTDVDGKITYNNPTVQTILGFSPEELEGQNTHSLIHEDDQARVMEMLPQWIANKTGWTGLVLRWRHKDGSYRYLESNSVPIINPAGKLLGFRGTDRDITDRILTEEAIEKSERHFRSIWENSTDGLRLTDSTGVILRVNEAFCRLCEKTREELEGKPLSVIYKEDQGPHILSKHSERFEARSIDPHLVRHVTLWNGKQVWFEVSNSFFDTGEKEVALLGIFRDITERKWVESERETLIVELQEALSNIKQLSGLLPICASCKKIRDDKGYWTQVEKYIIEHTDAKFSHGVCPECAQKLYPEYFKK